MVVHVLLFTPAHIVINHQHVNMYFTTGPVNNKYGMLTSSHCKSRAYSNIGTRKSNVRGTTLVPNMRKTCRSITATIHWTWADLYSNQNSTLELQMMFLYKSLYKCKFKQILFIQVWQFPISYLTSSHLRPCIHTNILPIDNRRRYTHSDFCVCGRETCQHAIDSRCPRTEVHYFCIFFPDVNWLNYYIYFKFMEKIYYFQSN